MSTRSDVVAARMSRLSRSWLLSAPVEPASACASRWCKLLLAGWLVLAMGCAEEVSPPSDATLSESSVSQTPVLEPSPTKQANAPTDVAPAVVEDGAVLESPSSPKHSALVAAPAAVISALSSSPHLRDVRQSDIQVEDYEIGLGAMKKVRGVWAFKHSERLSGLLKTFTWQVVDRYTGQQMLERARTAVLGDQVVAPLFSCVGRACGQSAQWANRVFAQRLLYGAENDQRYEVYALQEGDQAYRLQLYSSVRGTERQYLHVQLLQVAD